MKFKTPWNASEFPKDYQIPYGISCTVPDQAMSIQQIMQRFAAGLPVDGERVPFYEGDENTPDEELIGFPDLTKMDLAEREQYLKDTQRQLDQLKTQIQQKHNDYMQAKAIADQGEETQRTTGAKDHQGTDSAPDQYPKKIRGAGAAPRNEAKGKASEKGEE